LLLVGSRSRMRWSCEGSKLKAPAKCGLLQVCPLSLYSKIQQSVSEIGEDAVAGKSGVSYASSINRRGDHGSFSPTDAHISLMASGPDFKSGLHDPLPTANVDLAPTVARILKFSMPDAQGRVLEEALRGGPPITEYAVVNKTHRSPIRSGLTVKLATDLDGRSVDPKLSSCSVEVKTKILTRRATLSSIRPMLSANEFSLPEILSGSPCFICS
jgi:hypothetical protein